MKTASLQGKIPMFGISAAKIKYLFEELMWMYKICLFLYWVIFKG